MTRKEIFDTKVRARGAVTDLDWDPNEDNLISVFADGSMALISFQGVDSATRVVKRWETQGGISIDLLQWIPDRSGDFVTASKNSPVICRWNVAKNEPKRSFKVQGKGVQAIMLLEQSTQMSKQANTMTGMATHNASSL